MSEAHVCDIKEVFILDDPLRFFYWKDEQDTQ